MKCALSFVLVVSAALSVASAAQTAFSEDFETGSLFPLGPGFTRTSLAGVPGAPNTSPPLPINQGDDTELWYAYYGYGAHVVSLADGFHENVRIEGYLGVGWGSHAGFVLRAADDKDFYVVVLSASSSQFYLRRSANGVLGLTPPTPPSIPIPDMDPANENYHAVFEVSGTHLFASLSRVTLDNGSLVETPLGSISTTDAALTGGQVGLYAFSGSSGQGAFFDDIQITVIPEATGVGYGSAGLLWLLARRAGRRRRGAQSESSACAN